MTSEKEHGYHADHEHERVVAAKQRKTEQREQEIRDQERRRVCALIEPELSPDTTGFCPGGMI